MTLITGFNASALIEERVGHALLSIVNESSHSHCTHLYINYSCEHAPICYVGILQVTRGSVIWPEFITNMREFPSLSLSLFHPFLLPFFDNRIAAIIVFDLTR